jgi:hypothetical protein
MSTLPVRQAAAFPEVAIIRKGTPKRKGKPGTNGRETWIQGTDLKGKFRIQFQPGADEARKRFHALHEKEYKQYGPNFAIPDGYEVKEIRGVIPFADAFYGWYWRNEAYNSGRLIAAADDQYYITKRDPLNGEYIIRDGVYVNDGVSRLRYAIGDRIEYKRGDRNHVLPVKFHGRLRVLLPELDMLASFTLKTTSWYDLTTIEASLGAIQEMANMVNNGMAGGIPFWMYRAENDVAWNHADGTASRTKIWSVYLRIDEVAVKALLRRLTNFALTGEAVAGLLQQPEVELAGPVNPEDESFDDPENERPEVLDSSFVNEVVDQAAPDVDDSQVKPITIQSKVKRSQRPTGGPVAFLMDEHDLSTSDAAAMANLLKLTDPKLSRDEWARRYSNFMSLIDSGKARDEAAALAIQGVTA